MRRPVGLLLVLLGCNQVFGVKDTQREYLDAHVDAPPACPAIGTLAFTTTPKQRYLQHCRDFTESADGSIAIAMCTYDNDLAPPVISQSVAGAPFEPLGLEEPGTILLAPRLWPEGDVLHVHTTQSGALRTYRRGGDGTWVRGDDLALPASIQFAYWASTPSAAPSRRMVVAALSGGGMHLYELAEATPTWEIADELAVAFETGGDAHLTPDGAHLVTGGTQVRLVERSATGKLDSETQPAVPSLVDPFLTPDCGRLYFSAFSSIIYYVQQ